MEFKFRRCLVQAIAMTASDLSASAKPWNIQLQTVKVIFQEFYEQGDEERRAGRQPIPMMDRLQPEQQSASQVGIVWFKYFSQKISEAGYLGSTCYSIQSQCTYIPTT